MGGCLSACIRTAGPGHIAHKPNDDLLKVLDPATGTVVGSSTPAGTTTTPGPLRRLHPKSLEELRLVLELHGAGPARQGAGGSPDTSATSQQRRLERELWAELTEGRCQLLVCNSTRRLVRAVHFVEVAFVHDRRVLIERSRVQGGQMTRRYATPVSLISLTSPESEQVDWERALVEMCVTQLGLEVVHSSDPTVSGVAAPGLKGSAVHLTDSGRVTKSLSCGAPVAPGINVGEVRVPGLSVKRETYQRSEQPRTVESTTYPGLLCQYYRHSVVATVRPESFSSNFVTWSDEFETIERRPDGEGDVTHVWVLYKASMWRSLGMSFGPLTESNESNGTDVILDREGAKVLAPGSVDTTIIPRQSSGFTLAMRAGLGMGFNTDPGLDDDDDDDDELMLRALERTSHWVRSLSAISPPEVADTFSQVELRSPLVESGSRA